MGRNPVPSARNPSFFKVLIGDFTNHLKIPPAYVKRVECFNEASLGESCMLRSHANDKLWHVYVKMIDNNLCFQKGWSDFVNYNSLELGDFLVFRYVGNLQFVVEIYDTICCEKKIRTEENNRKPRFVKTFSNVDVTSSDYVHGKNGAIEAATNFLSKSKYPSFKIIMRPAYLLTGYLAVHVNHHPISTINSGDNLCIGLYVHHLPTSFSTQMKRGIRNVRIEALDNSWEVRFLAAGLGGRLSGGWKQCVRDNSLQLDDVCVFELINKKDSVLKLSIFRK